jgi:dipeptidyl aminopeptidase/acylaminoacyl peptidase
MHDSEENGTIRTIDSLLMVAFCPANKYNGFYLKKLNRKGNPELLSMGPYTFNHKMSSLFFSQELDDGMIPLKAADANVWIVKRMNACEAPNFFLTSDFKSYKALTYLQPQKAYNWLTTELVTWKQLDGKKCQGVLYKPEDFDPRKKYPVIFNYYEQRSHRLYEFPKPDFIHGNIDIPWFVSNGYLVFTPDYHQTIASVSGKTNEDNIFNSVVSAVNYLAQKSWVDREKIGIQGHSHGGFLTNYLITKTNLFAAAAEAAGGSDYVNCYLSISTRGRNSLQGVETGQGRVGATLWERPDLYLRKSSVLEANKVNTPLFIMHNKADYAVPWAQGIEMFMALYRLNKKVWMVQYDNGDHEVSGKDAIDYTIRLTQFFDHYLKGAAPPRWMTTGIPASMKGIDSGYSLEPSGKCGNDCKVCQK